MDEIKQVYIGLPAHLKNAIFWVARRYQTNPLSHEDGGSDVVVEYHTKKALGYHYIKFPANYIETIFRNEFQKQNINYVNLNSAEKLTFIKTVVWKIYARKYRNSTDYETKPFEEVWNSETATELPYSSLEKFNPYSTKKRNSFQDSLYREDDDEEYYSSFYDDPSNWEQTENYQEVKIEPKPLNKRKQKKQDYFEKYNTLSLVDKLKTIINSGKPLTYYPTDIAKPSIDVLQELSSHERNNLYDLIREFKVKEWYGTANEIRILGDKHLKRFYDKLRATK